jgi:hypothetical protein
MFSSPQISPRHHCQYNLTAQQITVAFHQHFLFGSGLYFLLFCEFQSHIAGKKQASPQILLVVSGKEVLCEEGVYDLKNPFLHITYTSLC